MRNREGNETALLNVFLYQPRAPRQQDGTGFKLSKRRRRKSTMNQARRLSRQARNRAGSKHPASPCNQPRHRHPWGSVGGWNVPRSKPMVTQPSPSRRPALLINRDGMGRPTRRRRTLQLRADRGSVSPLIQDKNRASLHDIRTDLEERFNFSPLLLEAPLGGTLDRGRGASGSGAARPPRQCV